MNPHLCLIGVISALLPLWAIATPPAPPDLIETDIQLEGDNARVEVRFSYGPASEPTLMPLVTGPISLDSADLPPQSLLFADEETVVLYDPGQRSWFGRPAAYPLRLRFLGRGSVEDRTSGEEAGFRTIRFWLPSALIHRLTVRGDRPDVSIELGAGVRAAREQDADGRPLVQAFLPVTPDGRCPVEIRWKSKPPKSEGALVASCEANVIASTTVGALRLDHLFLWRIAQGTLQQLTFRIPDSVPITDVIGDDIQDWHLENRPDGDRQLVLTLRRPWEGLYRVQIRAEKPLATLPCTFELPVLQPLGVLRTSGFLLVGAETAVKLSLRKTVGLTQIDLNAFPQAAISSAAPPRPKPTRYATAWQYANLPYLLVLEAEDIVPDYGSEDRLILTVGDSDLSLAISSEVEVREAPLREVTFQTDPTWAVASIAGNALADYDVRDHDGIRLLHLTFKTPLLGRTLLQFRLERSLPPSEPTFSLPSFVLAGAREQRGYVVAAAEKGLQLAAVRTEGLREVQIGAVPIRLPEAQIAWRFREASWTAELAVERTRPVLHAEVFSLGSMGEGVLYESAIFTFFISGAPVRTLRVRIPGNRRNVEFSGRSIRSWSRDNNVWTIVLQERVMGSYTLLATFDQPLDYESGELHAGGLSAVDAESEVGYLVLSGDAHLAVAPRALESSYIPLDREEIPAAYNLLIQNPVAAAYKHLGPGREATFAFTRFRTEQLLDQVVDHASLETRLSRNGEAVTRVLWFVKNASQQYLAFQLPAGVSLWTVKTAAENQPLREVAPLRGQEAILVPLERLRDPNTPIQVEITCAATSTPLGRLGATVTLTGPLLPAAPAAFMRWTVSVPDEAWRLRWIGGNLTPDSTDEAALGQVLINVASLWAAITIGLPFLALTALGLLGGLSVILFATARRHGLGPAVLLAILLVIVGLTAGGIVTALFDPSPVSFLGRLSIAAGKPMITASRILVPSHGEAPQLRCLVTPAWAGSSRPLASLILGPAATLLFFGLALARQKGRSGWILAVLSFALALSGWTVGRGLLTVALGIGLPLGLAIQLLRAAWRAGAARRLLPEPPPVPPEETKPMPPSPAATSTALLLVAVAAALSPVRADEPLRPTPPPLRLEQMQMTISAPPLSRQADPAVPIEARYHLQAARPGRLSLLILNSNTVLAAFHADSPHLRAIRTPDGLEIEAKRAGRYAFSLSFYVTATFDGPAWDDARLEFDSAKALNSEIQVRVPQRQIEFHSIEDAAYQTVQETDRETVLRFRPAPRRRTVIGWKTRARRTELEEAAYSAEMLTTATFEPGVIELATRVQLQISRGQIATLLFDVPSGMSVTAVSVPGLETWRFNADTRRLELLLAKPLIGAATVEILLQIPQEGLPYEAAVAPLVLLGADRQRGALALAAPDAVQLTVTRTENLTPLAIDDFPAARAGSGSSSARPLKRAFRYQQPPALLVAHAEGVRPEIRVEEKSTFSIAEERTVLSAQFDLTIARAGAFAITVIIPDEYEIDSISGTDVSHWEDWREGTNRGAVVRFQTQAIGERRLQGVFNRTGRGFSAALSLPRLTVREAVKHTGTRIVTAERGIRLSTEFRDGALEINPRDVGVLDPRALAFSILRPDWTVLLNVETLSPLVKPELLHRVHLAEGILQETVWIRYAIENAGCKTFRIQAPRPGLALSVSGRGVAKAFEADPTNGIWHIELATKAEQRVRLRLSAQRPFDPAQGRLTIEPFRPLDAENPRGWLVLSATDRLQIRSVGDEIGLNPEDARAIPAEFGADDLSDAILTYRAVVAEYRLALEVLRHSSAETLPARVRQVHLLSAVGEGGRMLTFASLELDVGDRRFLTLTLPHEEDRLWAVFVNGKVRRPSRQGPAYRIPLERAPEGEATTVQVLFASEAPFLGAVQLPAPAFDLPLNDITWTLYLRSDRLYWGVGGDFTLEARDRSIKPYDLSRYRQASLQQHEATLNRARAVLARGEAFQQKGAQREARQALEEAVVLTQGRADDNEDARIQYLNLVRQQALVGLAQRRAEFEREKAADAAAPTEALPSGFNAGNFTPDYVRKLEQHLPGEESAALQALAEKIIGQQQAAVERARAIRVTLPEEGVRLVVRRPMAIHPNATLTLSLRSIPQAPVRRTVAGGIVILGLTLSFLLVRRLRPTRS
jgi:hypothetical protein